MVASGELSAPIVIGRDHLDCGSVASPNRETESMKDGSDAIADWPLLNALINTASGASWVSLDNAQGDLETLRLIMSTDSDAVGFSSALNSTSTLAGNTNAVPHETAAGTGMLGALEIPSTGGDALLTEFDANKVFRYLSLIHI